MTKVNVLEYFRISPERFRSYLPRACAWVLEQERTILEHGVALTAPQLSDAKLAGVVHPERVRLLRVEEVPRPEHPVLRAAADEMKLITPLTPGLSLRYGIALRSHHWDQRRLLVHELAHTAQYERLGSVRAFLECYLYECLAIGYPSAPMEQEAIAVERRVCGAGQSRGMPDRRSSPFQQNDPPSPSQSW